MNQPKALLIDDEPDILELLTITLLRMGIHCETAETVSRAKQMVDNGHYDLCLTDMRLPDGNGLELVTYFQQKSPETPIALITAHGNMQTAIEAMKLGAFDFLSKPVDLTNLRQIVSSALMVNKVKNPASSSKISGGRQFIGETSIMQRLKQLIMRVAKSQAPIYIRGESGTGKEMVARLIHKNGPRSEQAFVAINCGAIPTELVESEFFGHKKGSFTGASADKTGLFQTAHGGTLFLDEIADLPLNMQVKLLRAIQERAIRPVGADQEVSVDVRILSASHKDLNQLVNQGLFRQDLFYRINVIEIDVPALRERKTDIPALINYFVQRISERNGMKPPKLSTEAVKKIQNYSFPGNIRELENILERALTLSFDETLQAEDIKLVTLEQTNDSTAPVGRKTQALDEYLEGIERKEILKALNETGGNKTAAAEILGISFRAMRYKCKKLDIE